MTESGNSKSGESDPRQAPDTPLKSVLSIALIGPDDDRRKAILSVLSESEAARISEFTSFPPDLDELPRTVGEHYDVIVLDVDSDPDYVFNLVERISSSSAASVMVYSAESDVKQAVRFMRAGAREYFTLPFVTTEVVAALTRAAAHPPAVPVQGVKTTGQVCRLPRRKRRMRCNFTRVQLCHAGGPGVGTGHAPDRLWPAPW